MRPQTTTAKTQKTDVTFNLPPKAELNPGYNILATGRLLCCWDTSELPVTVWPYFTCRTSWCEVTGSLPHHCPPPSPLNVVFSVVCLWLRLQATIMGAVLLPLHFCLPLKLTHLYQLSCLTHLCPLLPSSHSPILCDSKSTHLFPYQGRSLFFVSFI